jgi:hypothetical protein
MIRFRLLIALLIGISMGASSEVVHAAASTYDGPQLARVEVDVAPTTGVASSQVSHAPGYLVPRSSLARWSCTTRSPTFVATEADDGGPTGQEHHLIFRRVAAALAAHPTLKGLYQPRDPRFVARAKDRESHCGYQGWHRDIDAEIESGCRGIRTRIRGISSPSCGSGMRSRIRLGGSLVVYGASSSMFVRRRVLHRVVDVEYEKSEPIVRGEALRCGACGRFTGTLPWLAPRRARIISHGEVMGDIAFVGDSDFLVSGPFVAAFEACGLVGVGGFELVDVFRGAGGLESIPFS